MALNSPGVQVSVIDESFYVPAEPGTRPLLIVASKQNKNNASGTGIAVGTLQANAGKPYLITSQRELVETFGTPLFYKDSSQNPIHGGELNEYGLQAAYSYLGVSNSAYVVRSDLDTAQLIPSTTIPGDKPVNGTYWFDTRNTNFGIFEWNGEAAVTKGGQKFTHKIPTVITDITKIDESSNAGAPRASIGKVGDYAVVAISTLNKVFYKNRNNEWVLVGSSEWNMSWPVTTSKAISPNNLTAGNSFVLNGVEITVPAFPDDTVSGIATAIGTASIQGISAAVVAGRLEIYSNGQVDNSSTDSVLSNEITIAAGYTATGTVPLVSASGTLATSALGIATGTYLGPALQISSHTRVPNFKRKDLKITSSDTVQTGRPSGSIWVKTTNVNQGANWVVKEYSTDINDWIQVSAPVYNTNQEAIYTLDRVGGGLNIPGGSLFVQADVGEDQGSDTTPRVGTFKIYRRNETGATTVTSKVILGPEFDNTQEPPVQTQYATFTADYEYSFKMAVSEPGLSTLSSDYTITFTAHGQVSDAGEIAANINAQIIPNVVAEVDSRNRVVIRHETGGEIRFKDGIENVVSGDNVAVTALVTGQLYTITSLGNTSTQHWHDVGVATGTTPAVDVMFIASGTTTGSGTVKATAERMAPISMIYTPFSMETSDGTINFYETPTNAPIDTGENVYTAPGDALHDYVMTHWKPLVYTASDSEPSVIPADGTLWFDPTLTEVDIMIHNGVTWVGYLYNGGILPSTASPYYSSDTTAQTDPNGPIITATKPVAQSDGSHLVDGDLWIDSGDHENYPALYKWDGFNLIWVPVDNTDQTTEDGILFADARFNTAGANSNTAGDITDLLVSNYLDYDAPDPALYPRGMLLFNTRRSGNNVKRFVHSYIDKNVSNIRYNGNVAIPVSSETGESQFYYDSTDGVNHDNPTALHRWVNESGNATNGAGLFGRKAQRKVVVKHFKALVDTNQDIREQEIRTFNLIACPGYPELMSNMVNLNVDRKQTAFVIGDTPFRLQNNATALNEWGTNSKIVTDNGEDGLVTADEYLGVYYPSGFTTDNAGNDIVVPASHMVLRTIALSDNVSYPWFAPAGTRRGAVNNATSVGYVNSEDGEWKSISLNEGQRDTLYSIGVNPITYLTGSGIVVFGQKTRAKNASALDRINVARLVVYLRGQLSKLAKPYIFEPNDKITRDELKAAAESIMLELVGQRAIYDYLVVCDDSNNTPSRIDRNELYLDIAIEPVKAVEFIYIPLRLKNTGEIAGIGKK